MFWLGSYSDIVINSLGQKCQRLKAQFPLSIHLKKNLDIYEKHMKSAKTLITFNVQEADVNFPHLPLYFFFCNYLFWTSVKPKKRWTRYLHHYFKLWTCCSKPHVNCHFRFHCKRDDTFSKQTWLWSWLHDENGSGVIHHPPPNKI